MLYNTAKRLGENTKHHVDRKTEILHGISNILFTFLETKEGLDRVCWDSESCLPIFPSGPTDQGPVRPVSRPQGGGGKLDIRS